MYIIFLKKIYIYIYIKFSGIPKGKHSDKTYRSTFQYFYCILVRKKVWQKYCLLMQKKNYFVEFHHFMKKERLNNSSRTFLNQWDPKVL